MKILLINPSFDYHSRHLLVGMPLSLAYLAAYLRKYSYEIGILDAVAGNITRKGAKWHYGLSENDIVEEVKKFKPDLVGITCSFSLRNDVTLETARLIKMIDDKIITVVGGIHPTISPLETVSVRGVDYVIIGEGEESFLSLVRHLESSNKVSELNVDGCAYKDGDEVKLIPKTKFIEDLDSIPFPARDLLPMESYIRKHTILYGLGKRRAASIITSRSCPGKCTFCCNYMSQGRKWRGRSAQNVFEEIKLLLEKYRIEEIFFLDDNLTFDKARMMELCEMILHKGLKFRWNTPNGIWAPALDIKLAGLMKKAGCVNICVGIESGNEMVRNKIIRKGVSGETIKKVLNICHKVGLPVVGFFIIGIPGENEDTFKDTIKFVKELPFTMIATSFFRPDPGTDLYNECLRKGYIEKDYWKNMKQFSTPMVETPSFNLNTLKKWEKKIYYEFFKAHFWELAYSTLTFRNDFFKWEHIARFVEEKFNIVKF